MFHCSLKKDSLCVTFRKSIFALCQMRLLKYQSPITIIYATSLYSNEKLKPEKCSVHWGQSLNEDSFLFLYSSNFTRYYKVAASPLWRNSGGRRRFRVTIGRLVVGSIPGRDLRERNFGGAQNHNKEW